MHIAPCDVGGRKARDQRGRVARDADGGVGGIPALAAGIVRIVTGDAGLRVHLVPRPGYCDVGERIRVRSSSSRIGSQVRKPFTEWQRAQLAARALVLRELVVRVGGELPLLIATVPQRLAVTLGAVGRGERDAHGFVAVRGEFRARTVAILALALARRAVAGSRSPPWTSCRWDCWEHC